MLLNQKKKYNITIDCGAVHDRGEHAHSDSEKPSYRTHSENNMQLVSYSFLKELVGVAVLQLSSVVSHFIVYFIDFVFA